MESKRNLNVHLQVGKVRTLILTFLVLLSSSCASYTDLTQKVIRDYDYGDAQGALNELENSYLKDSSRDRVLYLLQKAVLLDRLNMRVSSRKQILEAEKVSRDFYTESISQMAASFVYNDSVQNYPGEIYEIVGSQIFNALSYIEDKNFDEAQVAARKINSTLQELTQELDPSANSYTDDAFGRYLSGILFEAKNDPDNAMLAYKKAFAGYTSKSFKGFHQGNMENQVGKALARLALKEGRDDLVDIVKKFNSELIPASVVKNKKALPEGELVIIHEVGRINQKYAKDFILPIASQIIRFSFPVMPEPYSLYYTVSATSDNMGGTSTTAQNGVDYNRIAYQVMEDRRTRMIVKESARLLVKGQLVDQARQKFGPLAGIAANIYSAVSETADTRGWTLMPKAIYVSRFFLPLGSHKIRIQTGSRFHLESIEIKRPGEVVILRSSEYKTNQGVPNDKNSPLSSRT